VRTPYYIVVKINEDKTHQIVHSQLGDYREPNPFWIWSLNRQVEIGGGDMEKKTFIRFIVIVGFLSIFDFAPVAFGVSGAYKENIYQWNTQAG